MNVSENRYKTSNNMIKLICFSAPSGTGKSTVIAKILERHPDFALSISATTRVLRGKEQNGVDYIFLSPDEFREKIAKDLLMEYEEVHGQYYGTLKETVDSCTQNGQLVLFDIDVNGARTIKKKFGREALLFFLKPPSIEELRSRLENRHTESLEKIEKRLERLPYELEMGVEFDYIVINDDLDDTVDKIDKIIKKETLQP